VVVVVVVDFVSGAGAGSVVVVVLLVVVVGAGSAAGAGAAGVMLVVLFFEQPIVSAPAKISAKRLVVFIMRILSRIQSGLSTTAQSAMLYS